MALLVSLAVRQCVVQWKEVSSRLMCMKIKFGLELGVYVCIWSR